MCQKTVPSASQVNEMVTKILEINSKTQRHNTNDLEIKLWTYVEKEQWELLRSIYDLEKVILKQGGNRNVTSR